MQSAQQAVAILEKVPAEETAYLYDLACHRALCAALASAGKGSVAVILPDTVTSARYT